MDELGMHIPLSDLEDGQLYQNSQDIAGALWAAGIDETDCGFTGLVEVTDASGWEVREIWATDFSRPFDLTANYTLIHAAGKSAPVDRWPGLGHAWTSARPRRSPGGHFLLT